MSTASKVEWCGVLGLDVWARTTEAQVRAAARQALLEHHQDRSGRRDLDPDSILSAKALALEFLGAEDRAEPMDLD